MGRVSGPRITDLLGGEIEAANSSDDERNSGPGPAAAFVLLALSVVALAWATVIAGLLPRPVEALVIDLLQVAASVFAALMLMRSVRQGHPAAGAGTSLLAAGAVTWASTDLAWALFEGFGSGAPTGLSLGYTAGTTLYALGACRSARADHCPAQRGPLRASLQVDIALLVISVATFWWLLVWQAQASREAEAVSFATTAADCLFLVMALIAWTRAPEWRRQGAGLVVVAATTLLPTDIAFLHGVQDSGHVLSTVMDFSWFSVSIAIGCVALLARPGDTRSTGRAAALAEGVGAPVAALAVLGLVALRQASGDSRSLHFLVVLLVLLVALRIGLRFAESQSLNDQLTESLERVARQADHDDLTGLLSRRAFLDRAGNVLQERRADGGQLAVIWLDLDAFKRINDTLGHLAGDHVLRVIADRMRDVSGPHDLLGRLGGDEFIALRPSADLDVELWAHEMRARLGRPIDVDGVEIRLTCSMGMVVSDGDTDEMSQLLIDGDIALYAAKRNGRDRINLFSPAQRAERTRRTAIASHIHRCVTEGDVIVRYQPVVELDSGAIIGAEALARLPDTSHGELSPAAFLPHVEAMGLMPALRDAVLNAGCAVFGPRPELGWLAVNLSSEDLADAHLISALEHALSRDAMPPERLVLEVNEKVVPESHIVGAARLLNSLGVRLALDDFGSGWSSLAQLRDLELAMVKVDRDVVAGAADRSRAVRGERERALLTASVAVARALNLAVLCEGIETPHELETVRAAGAQMGQGFLWSAALPAEELVRLATRVHQPSPR